MTDPTPAQTTAPPTLPPDLLADIPAAYLKHPIGKFPSEWRDALCYWLESKKWAFYLFSEQNGSGKSCFAGAVLRAYRENLIHKGVKWPDYLPGNRGGRWMSLPHWIPKIRTFDTWPFHRGAFDKTPFLVVDDLAAGRNTPHVCEEMDLLLMRRYERARDGDGLRTIITSNLPLGKLASAMSRRLASRLQEGWLVEAGNVDWRATPPK